MTKICDRVWSKKNYLMNGKTIKEELNNESV